MAFPIPLTRPLVIFDVESTGLSPRKDRIIELGVCKAMPDGSMVENCWLLNPTIHIPEDTTAIHGIADADVANCPTFAESAQEIFDFFKDCDIGGFNSDHFDIPILEEEFVRCGLNFNAAARKRIDVQKIYHRKEPRDLSAALQFYCGRDHVGAHGAEADAKATLEVLGAQLQRYQDLPKTIADLDEWIVPHDPLNADRNGLIRWSVNDGEWKINFGKKKGESLHRLLLEEPNYLKWITKGDFEADVRGIAAAALEGRLPPAPAL